MIESTSNTVQQWYCLECREWKSAEGVKQCIYPTCINRNSATKLTHQAKPQGGQK